MNESASQNNFFVEKGKEFYNFCANIELEKDPIKRVEEILSDLKFCSKLKLYLANKEGIGDNSFFYTSDNNEKNKLKFIECEQTEMAAWQIYLLENSSTVMPYFWHGGYEERTYIFEIKDLFTIKDFHEEESIFDDKKIKLLSKKFVSPTIFIEESKAKITCCYWNYWKGLVKEISVLDFKKKTIKTVETKVLYKYNCCVLF